MRKEYGKLLFLKWAEIIIQLSVLFHYAERWYGMSTGGFTVELIEYSKETAAELVLIRNGQHHPEVGSHLQDLSNSKTRKNSHHWHQTLVQQVVAIDMVRPIPETP